MAWLWELPTISSVYRLMGAAGRTGGSLISQASICHATMVKLLMFLFLGVKQVFVLRWLCSICVAFLCFVALVDKNGILFNLLLFTYIILYCQQFLNAMWVLCLTILVPGIQSISIKAPKKRRRWSWNTPKQHQGKKTQTNKQQQKNINNNKTRKRWLILLEFLGFAFNHRLSTLKEEMLNDSMCERGWLTLFPAYSVSTSLCTMYM